MTCLEAGGSLGNSSARRSWNTGLYFFSAGHIALKVVSSQPVNSVIRIALLSKHIVRAPRRLNGPFIDDILFLQLASLTLGVAEKLDEEGAETGTPQHQHEYNEEPLHYWLLMEPVAALTVGILGLSATAFGTACVPAFT
jgi:hypothetical protein